MTAGRYPQGDAADHAKGPLSIRDIDDDVLREKDQRMGQPQAIKAAHYSLLFMKARLPCRRATGMLKTYDLLLRHFGWDKLPTATTQAETTACFVDRA